MRINIYDEELTGEAELVTKEGVKGEDGQPVTFVGIRFFLKGSDSLHHNEHDDDRQAITFWTRPTATGYAKLNMMWGQAQALCGLSTPQALSMAAKEMAL